MTKARIESMNPLASFSKPGGHAHIAHRTHPALVAEIVRDFIAD